LAGTAAETIASSPEGGWRSRGSSPDASAADVEADFGGGGMNVRIKTICTSVAVMAAMVGAGGVFAAEPQRVADLVEKGNTTAATALIKQGADVNAPQADGATALHWAAHRNDVALAKQLIAAGANANAVNDYASPRCSSRQLTAAPTSSGL